MEHNQTQYLNDIFQNCCEQYFIEKFQQNRFLYFDIIPHNYFGTEYKIEITRIKYDWQNSSILNYDILNSDDHRNGHKRCRFEQECTINYIIKLNNSLELSKQTKTVKFYAESFEPFGQTIHTTLISEDLISLDNIRKIKFSIKKDFQIKNIDEEKYEKELTSGFGFFTDVLRKERQAQATNSESISHGYVYWEIANCHREIEECLLTGLFHQKYSSDLLDNKQTHEGKDFYFPRFSYNDFQYLTMIGFGFDRLYSFWDRIIFLLSNYEPLGLNPRYLSMDSYFNSLDKKINNKQSFLFDENSENLKWLIKFHKIHFQKITKYRHRIVHYQITPKWEGTLSSKFVNNSFENVSNKEGIKELKLEFDSLGNLLYEQFNLCTEGFVRALKLIDELQ